MYSGEYDVCGVTLTECASTRGKLKSLPDYTVGIEPARGIGGNRTPTHTNSIWIPPWWESNTNTHKKYHILEYIDIEGTIDSVPKYHRLDLVAQLVEQPDWYPKRRGFDSHMHKHHVSSRNSIKIEI